MRVTVVTTWFPTARGTGVGSFIARDVQSLAIDHDVEVLHLVEPRLDDGRRRFMREGVPVRRVPVDVRTPRGILSATRNLPALLDGRDVVHSMAAPALLPFLVRRPRIPWVHTEHWTEVPRLASAGGLTRVLRPATRRAFEGPDEVVAVSEYLADHVRRLRKGPVSVIGNIVELPDRPQRNRRPEDRRTRVLGIANVIERKGWRLAVEAVADLRTQGHDTELVWLGDGPQLDELRRAGASALVRAPGRVGRDVLAQEMADADVFVLPTDVETFSLVTVEALAAGLPVVVSGEGAHTGFIVPGTGEVVSRRADRVADGIARAARLDRDAIRSHGAHLLAQFDEPTHRRAYMEVYEMVTA